MDGLRAVSILMVVGFHWMNAVVRAKTGTDYDGVWSCLLNGSLGVDVFFVISGFLITCLLIRERNKNGRIHLGRFYARRTFRIWPAFFVYLAAVCGLQKLHVIGIARESVVAAATFTANYASHGRNWWIGQTWSLSVEEQFYLIWPLVMVLLPARSAARVAVGLIVTLPLVRLVETMFLPGHSLLVSRMWQTTHTRADTLMFGCVAALVYDRPGFQRLISRCEAYGITVLAGVYLLASRTILDRLPSAAESAVGYTLQGACITLVLLWAVRHAASPLGRLLNCRPVVHLGHISFSLYLWQQLFFVSLNPSWTGRFPANLILAVAAAEASFHWIERPALAWRDRLMAGRARPTARPTSTIPLRAPAVY